MNQLPGSVSSSLFVTRQQRDSQIQQYQALLAQINLQKHQIHQHHQRILNFKKGEQLIAKMRELNAHLRSLLTQVAPPSPAAAEGAAGGGA